MTTTLDPLSSWVNSHNSLDSDDSIKITPLTDFFQPDSKNLKTCNLELTSSSSSSLAQTSNQTDKSANPEKNGIVEKEKGNAMFAQGHYKTAYRLYSEALLKNPQNAVFYSNRAACCLKLDFFVKAIQDCTQAIKYDPSNWKSWFRRAEANMKSKQWALSHSDLKKTLELKPGYKKALKFLNFVTQQILEGKTPKKRVVVQKSALETHVVPKHIKKGSQPTAPPMKLTSETVINLSKVSIGEINSLESNISENINKSQIVPEPSILPPEKEKSRIPKNPPKTGFEFETAWHSLADHPDVLHQYITQVVPPSQLGSLFEHFFSLTSYSLLIQVLTHKSFTVLYPTKENQFRLVVILAWISKMKLHPLLANSIDNSLKVRLQDVFHSLKQLSQAGELKAPVSKIEKLEKLYIVSQ